MQKVLLGLWCSTTNRIAELKEDQLGATAVEYAVMVALIAAVIIAVVEVVGGKTSTTFVRVNRRVP